MGNLALQISQIDRIVIDQRDVADASRTQVQRCGRAQAAGTNDQHMRGQDAFLPLNADFVEQDVARIAQKLLVVHGAACGLLRLVFILSLFFLALGLRFTR